MDVGCIPLKGKPTPHNVYYIYIYQSTMPIYDFLLGFLAFPRMEDFSLITKNGGIPAEVVKSWGDGNCLFDCDSIRFDFGRFFFGSFFLPWDLLAIKISKYEKQQVLLWTKPPFVIGPFQKFQRVCNCKLLRFLNHHPKGSPPFWKLVQSRLPWGFPAYSRLWNLYLGRGELGAGDFFSNTILKCQTC